MRQKGNSVLELLLFLPLALFFLFIVIDAGMCLLQRAALNDAFRATINSIPAIVKSESDQSVIARKVEETLNQNVARVFASYSGQASYQLHSAIYRVQVDPLNGKLISSSPVLIKEFSDGLITEKNLLDKFVDSKDYISKQLELDFIKARSDFAEPQGEVINPLDSRPATLRYAETSSLLYLELRAVPAGINLSYLKSTLGGLYSFQLQSLEKLRDY